MSDDKLTDFNYPLFSSYLGNVSVAFCNLSHMVY